MKGERDQTPFWTEMRWLVPFGTALLLLPPVLTLFSDGTALFGLPLMPVYIFIVWIGAIVLCAMTARHSAPPPQRPDRTGP